MFRGKTTDKANIKAIVSSVIKGDMTSLEKTSKLVFWMNSEFSWISNDYQNRSASEIILRKAGHCGEQTKVMTVLLDEANVKYRIVQEINLQARSRSRLKNSRERIKQVGFTASVFGRRHNDHRWVEIYDDKDNLWEPADATTGIVGTKAWIEARVGFSPRHGEVKAKGLLVPFVVVTEQNRIDRTSYYLIEQFNLYYCNKLGDLPSWGAWVLKVQSLSAAGIKAFHGDVNLHLFDDQMGDLAKIYNKLKTEASALFPPQRKKWNLEALVEWAKG